MAATDSCFALNGAQQRGKTIGLMNGETGVSEKPLLHAEVSARHSIKRHLLTTHVGPVGWGLHRSSPTSCAGKADHGFGSLAKNV